MNEERRKSDKVILEFLQDLSYKFGQMNEKISNIEIKQKEVDDFLKSKRVIRMIDFYCDHWEEKKRNKEMIKKTAIQIIVTKATTVIISIMICVILFFTTPIKNRFIDMIKEELKIEEVQNNDDNK
jgi:hypothetical protein